MPEPIAHRPSPRTRQGFTLLEVVVAIGIFAIGMVAVLGLFTPVAKSVGDSLDAEAAARVGESVLSRLRGLPFASVAGLLQAPATIAAKDARTNYNPNSAADPAAQKVLFARHDGSAVGVFDATKKVWLTEALATMRDADKYYEIDLIRNPSLSPAPTADNPDTDTNAVVLAFVMRIRWPCIIADLAGNPIQPGANPTGTVAFDHSQKQVLFLTGTVTR